MIWLMSLATIIEIFLLISGKWLLILEGERVGDDSYSGSSGYFQPATKSWRIRECTYWTGRSVQLVEDDEEMARITKTVIPRECPIIQSAF